MWLVSGIHIKENRGENGSINSHTHVSPPIHFISEGTIRISEVTLGNTLDLSQLK
jgi:hypothetical protein